NIEDDPIIFEPATIRARWSSASFLPPGKNPSTAYAVALRETSMQRAADNGWPAFIPAFTPPIPASNDPFGQLTHYFTATAMPCSTPAIATRW
ncbi:hypothetical protein ACGEDA_11325, partial [Klebsiella quasipneumoniae]